MPLSKARDRERKRQSRLESKNVQPKWMSQDRVVDLGDDYVGMHIYRGEPTKIDNIIRNKLTIDLISGKIGI